MTYITMLERVMTKKNLVKKKVHPRRENPAYAYVKQSV